MKTNGFIAIVLSLILIAAVFSACEFKNPLKIPETTEESTTQTTTLPPDFDSWNKSYSDYLLTLIDGAPNLAGYGYEIEECIFDLIDLDANNVPELLISEGDKDASKVDIYNYDGYQTRYAGSAGAGGKISYVPNAGILYSFEESNGQQTHTVYTYDGQAVKQKWQGVILETPSADNEEETVTQYFITGTEEPVSSGDYTREYAANVPAETQVFGREGFELNKENALALVSETGGEGVTGEDQSSTAAYVAQAIPEGEAALAYKTVLLDKILNEATADMQFDFRNIDSDDIPELLISRGKSEYSGVEVYGFDGEKAVLLCTSGSFGKTACGDGNGIVAGSFKTEENESCVVYKIDSAKCETVWKGEIITGEDGETEYYSNDENVSAQEYEAEYNEYFSEDTVTPTAETAYPLTEETINAVLA